MPTSALLTQKPDSPEPQPGQTRNFSLEQKPKKNKPGETWTKAKNERGDFGDTYEILKADRLDDYQHPQHGTFHQFSLLLEAVKSSEPSSGGGAVPVPSDREDSIARAVAFKGAIELVGRVNFPDDKPLDEIIGLVGTYTKALLPVVVGTPKVWMEAEDPTPPLDTAESVQADQTSDEVPPF